MRLLLPLVALATLVSVSTALPASSKAIRGTQGNDSLVGTSASDKLYGLAGNDRLEGGGGVDFLHGGPGNDTLIGGAASDWLYGGSGNDVLRSDQGRDITLQGDAGDDSIIVTNRVDVLLDGTIKDSLLEGFPVISCGTGNDSITVSGRVLNKRVVSYLLHGQGCETVKFTR